MFTTVKRHFYNFIGSNLRDKVLVIESDDWGAIRTTQKKNYHTFKNRFTEVGTNPYLRFDTIAGTEDLECLIQTLSKFKDLAGNSPIVTLNTVVANPDFEKIKSDKYSNYHFETFTKTLERYYPNQRVFELWQQGISEGVFFPQFHGREHVNVPVWLDLLRSGNDELLDAFQLETWSTPKGKYPKTNVKLQAALDYVGNEPSTHQIQFLKEGLQIFEQIFGFQSDTWIPNNFIASSKLIQESKKYGIKGMQGMIYHVEPIGQNKNNRHKYSLRRFGRDKFEMIHTIRNCTFEPSQSQAGMSEVKNCLAQIRNAFFWNKPAVISAHRLNFIGAIDPKNRERNLELLEVLLSEVLKEWPEVKFLNASQLVDSYHNASSKNE